MVKHYANWPVSARDTDEIRALLPVVAGEMRCAVPETVTEAAQVIFDALASEWSANAISDSDVAAYADRVVFLSWESPSVLEMPLGAIYGVADFLHADWGPPKSELMAKVRQACADQLAATA